MDRKWISRGTSTTGVVWEMGAMTERPLITGTYHCPWMICSITHGAESRSRRFNGSWRTEFNRGPPRSLCDETSEAIDKSRMRRGCMWQEERAKETRVDWHGGRSSRLSTGGSCLPRTSAGDERNLTSCHDRLTALTARLSSPLPIASSSLAVHHQRPLGP